MPEDASLARWNSPAPPRSRSKIVLHALLPMASILMGVTPSTADDLAPTSTNQRGVATDQDQRHAGLLGDRSIEAGRTWWAVQPLNQPAIPLLADQGDQDWVQNPIDSLLRVEQVAMEIPRGAAADKATLIRRATLDLTGLPPSPAEVEAFVADDHPHAYDRVLDRLLGSPAYGERWARFWLDLARYADSGGFEFDYRRPQSYRYRDWVVQALNLDLPFDEFVQLQLAADELAPEQPEHKAALGFLRNGPSVGNEMSEKIRMDELDDVVSTTGSVFLGLTLGCARCHDHKFDPIPLEDYYRMVAVFAPSRFEEVELAHPTTVRQHRAVTRAFEEQADSMREGATAIQRTARNRLEAQRRAALPAAWRKALDTGDIQPLSKDEQSQLNERLKITEEQVEEQLHPFERVMKEEFLARAACFEAAKPAPLPRALGVIESGPRARPVYQLLRGDVNQKGPEVRPGPPRAVTRAKVDFPDASEGAASTMRRSSLARWITRDAHPLTARVIVNRLWQGHFGQGLVPTASDFGAMGEEPIVPELLDWLAFEFVRQGWRPKTLHRLILTSATYRLSSRQRAQAQAIDPDNALWWRYPVRRLDGEVIRDGILACSGTLNQRMGGPGVFPPIDPSVVKTGNVPRWPLDAQDGFDVWRRSLYLFQMRSVPIPLLDVFDLPESTQSCPRRASTTIPTQSLSLLNNPWVIEQSRHFAARVVTEAGPGAAPAHLIERAYQIATGKRPTPEILSRVVNYLGTRPSDSALAEFCHVLLNSNAFLYLD